MKRLSTIFLQVIIVLMGIGVLAFMLWEPHLEGRNVDATLFEIYFKDPFLAYVYLSSIAFFVGLWKAFQVLGFVQQEKTFTQMTANALGTIQYCALATAGLIVVADAFLLIAVRNSADDPAGVIALSIVATFISLVVAAAAAVLERIVQEAV